MKRVRTAIVAGGGIAGSVAAIALRKAGIEARVYEAYSTPADGVGGGLLLAPNGVAALEAIGVAVAGIPTLRLVMETGAGRRLGTVNGLPGLPISQSFARSALSGRLASLVGDVVPGKRLTGYTEHADGVTAIFADGSAATADLLIGADGIRSVVRTLLDPGAPEPRYAGLLGFGGWVASDRLPRTAGEMHFAFGKRAFFGYQVTDESASWFANLPWPAALSAAEARAVPEQEWLRRLRALYEGETASALLDRVSPGSLVTVGALQDMPPVPVWHRGRVVLVGDAAHATSPSSGQGASLAIESAVELARCLRDLPIAEAFAAYERLRRARVERVIATTARVNRDKAAGPVARIVRDLTFPIAMRTFYRPERMFGWVHRHAIDWAAPVTTS